MLSYPEAIDFLYSFIDHKRQRAQRYAPERMPLERPTRLMGRLGNPQQAYPVVHLTGTKGKGSVGAMLAAMLRAAGYRVGLYSSPHLQDFRERLRVNDQLIASGILAALVSDLRPVLEDTPHITWFEAVTALAFEHFRRQAVDVAVIEVGIGGRLDATNVVHPLASVITSLSLDHTALLGDTLPEIAYEKAGIIKPNVPLISAPQPPEALAVIEAHAEAQQAPLTLVGRDWHYTPLEGDIHLRVERWQAAPQGAAPQPYETSLLGQHQVLNGTVALAAAAVLNAQGLAIAPEAQRAGLRRVNWPGRLEIVRQAPLVILDAAHNGASATWLAKTLRHYFPHQPYTLVFAAKADKDIDGMLAALMPITQHLILTQPLDTRGAPMDTVLEHARAAGYTGEAALIASVAEALAAAQDRTPAEGVICVTGSMYLIGEARTVYGLQPGYAVSLDAENDNVSSQ